MSLDIIEAFNSSSRYLDDLLNIDNPYFEQMLGQIYPTELQLNKANSSDTEAPFLDLNLSITAKLLKQGYRYHKIRKAFSKFYQRHSELIVKYNIGYKTLLQQGISESIFYGD